MRSTARCVRRARGFLRPVVRTSPRLQARAGMMDERGARTYWRAGASDTERSVSGRATGTQFHAWAERFIMADANDAGIGVGASGNGGTRVAESRLAMLAELRRNNAAQSQDNQDDNGADNNGIFDWQQRLATSTWARRKPAWAERQIVVNVPQLGTIVNGKLDAVFFGGLDGADRSKQYTIVDWKTGKNLAKRGNSEKIAQFGYVSYLAVGNGGRTAYRYRRLPLLSE